MQGISAETRAGVDAPVTEARREIGARLRIAIDMDEVMADALSEHVRRWLWPDVQAVTS